MRTSKAMPRIEIIGIAGIPEVKEGDDLSRIICESAEKQGTPLREGDIVVVTSKIVSLAEGKLVDLRSMKPSTFAERIASEQGKDPRQIEVILRETKSIVRMTRNHLIVETKHGFICANAGVDKSNIRGGNMVATLPDDPDLSSKRIKDGISRVGGIELAIIVADTFGRSLRRGVANVAIGVAGLVPILDLRGTPDMYGYKLRVTQIAVADELAASAELVMGKTNWIPVVIIRGYKYEKSKDATSKTLLLPEEEDIFR
jgi:coenzyme F420-0:L-glutamate ligase/coenzyme F420-1:gamma-L-glutamate ligase